MQDALVSKIQRIVSLGPGASENDVRTLAVLIRKRLELMKDISPYVTLNLFCNWAVHIEITDSMTGLRTLAKINDILARPFEHGELVAAIGFDRLRSELTALLDDTPIAHKFYEDSAWNAFLQHLIEIIRDTPIQFPPISEMQKSKSKAKAFELYKGIAKTSSVPGAGVVGMALTDVGNRRWCLVMRTEKGSEIMVMLEPTDTCPW